MFLRRNLPLITRAAFERALAIDEAVFGPEHPKVARDVNNLGLVLRDLGDYAGVKAAYERVLVILENHFPPDHSLFSLFAQVDLQVLANIQLGKLQNFDEAE